MCWLHPQMFLGCKNRRVKSKLEKRVAPNTVGFSRIPGKSSIVYSSTQKLCVFAGPKQCQKNTKQIPKETQLQKYPQKKYGRKKTQIRLPFTCRHWLPSHALGADGFEGGRVQQLPQAHQCQSRTWVQYMRKGQHHWEVRDMWKTLMFI
jgi:hypothetical protein